MQNSRINRLKTASALFLLALIVFAISYSLLECDHDCCGEECPVCLIIQIAEGNLKLLEIASLLISLLILARVPKTKEPSHKQTYPLYSNTLITSKIRLND